MRKSVYLNGERVTKGELLDLMCDAGLKDFVDRFFFKSYSELAYVFIINVHHDCSKLLASLRSDFVIEYDPCSFKLCVTYEQ